MEFPLKLQFKLIALAPQLWVHDARGNLLGYVKQKLLKLKESVTVYADEAQTKPIYTMNANRILDINARYTLANTAGQTVATLDRSIWRSMKALFTNSITHTINLDEKPVFVVKDEKPSRVFWNGLLGNLPVVNLITGYFLNPTYTMRREGTGEEILRLVKQPALFESAFTVELVGNISPREQEAALLSLMMIVLLERSRG
ncbi:MAG: hypothetical protein RL291_2070 [Pseudomonadota bacterium]